MLSIRITTMIVLLAIVTIVSLSSSSSSTVAAPPGLSFASAFALSIVLPRNSVDRTKRQQQHSRSFLFSVSSSPTASSTSSSTASFTTSSSSMISRRQQQHQQQQQDLQDAAQRWNHQARRLQQLNRKIERVQATWLARSRSTQIQHNQQTLEACTQKKRKNNRTVRGSQDGRFSLSADAYYLRDQQPPAVLETQQRQHRIQQVERTSPVLCSLSFAERQQLNVLSHSQSTSTHRTSKRKKALRMTMVLIFYTFLFLLNRVVAGMTGVPTPAIVV